MPIFLQVCLSVMTSIIVVQVVVESAARTVVAKYREGQSSVYINRRALSFVNGPL
jgi:hypothetical protein